VPIDAHELLGYAERPRVGDWSLRGALVRYAQPRPALAGAVLELVRRTDGALRSLSPTDDDPDAVALLDVAGQLDRLGDVLARWADDRSTERPDAEVERTARQVFEALADLGVARETRPPRRA
jgi:hypothetical protein